MGIFSSRKNNNVSDCELTRYKATITCTLGDCANNPKIINVYSLISPYDAEAKLITALDDHEIAKHDG